MNYSKGSVPGFLSRFDWRKIGKGFLIAMGGSVVAYVASEIIPLLEVMDLSPGEAVMVGLASTLINFLQKWLSDTRY